MEFQLHHKGLVVTRFMVRQALNRTVQGKLAILSSTLHFVLHFVLRLNVEGRLSVEGRLRPEGSPSKDRASKTAQ